MDRIDCQNPLPTHTEHIEVEIELATLMPLDRIEPSNLSNASAPGSRSGQVASSPAVTTIFPTHGPSALIVPRQHPRHNGLTAERTQNPLPTHTEHIEVEIELLTLMSLDRTVYTDSTR